MVQKRDKKYHKSVNITHFPLLGLINSPIRLDSGFCIDHVSIKLKESSTLSLNVCVDVMLFSRMFLYYY